MNPARPRTSLWCLNETNPLRGIAGRFDHFGNDRGNVVSELGDNHALVINTGGRVLEQRLAVRDAHETAGLSLNVGVPLPG